MKQRSVEETRALILAQVCPWCDDGRVWKAIAIHAAKRHGIDSLTVRNAGGFTKSESICSAEYSEKLRENALNMEPWVKSPPVRPNRAKPVFSDKGKENKTAALVLVNKSLGADVRSARMIGKNRFHTHGRAYEYERHGCRCKACTAAYATYRANRNAAARARHAATKSSKSAHE